MTSFKFGMIAAFALAGSAAIAQSQMPSTVVDIVTGSDNHTTLEQAVIAADLAGALSGEGPFTVLAPTDTAFAALPAGTLDEVLKPENKDKLVQILGCHVVEAKAMAADVAKMIQDDGGTHDVTTMGNCRLSLSLDGDKVKINNAITVSAADLQAGNGVVHVINGVLLPKM